MAYWFKRKRYGWGWTPANGKGWLVLGAYFLWVLWAVFDAERQTHTSIDAVRGASMPVLAGTILLIAICYATGESPRWQWGDRDTQ